MNPCPNPATACSLWRNGGEANYLGEIMAITDSLKTQMAPASLSDDQRGAAKRLVGLNDIRDC
jgi:hypothetical protein